MPSSRQILDGIALAAKSNISDREFRAIVIALVQPNREPTVRKPASARREPLPMPRPEQVRRETLAPPLPIQNARPGSASYYYKLFRVKRADGRVTTVSLDPVVVAKATQRLGGAKEVGALVRKLALSYLKADGARSCSRFVSQGLFTAMASVTTTAGESVR
jgi:hypothetical protein